ncbi:AraC family transcriptional regulator [Chelativorans salis]|uniref:Helix-turn-helix domain-containing protein n=1 Tax=Chelativorans salis TaxID=2978478 RepID=A0ABT2LNP5_9HYPH|nr:helix-turn-helix domain-containing protein [Chelativorans sp. EGI FJ00035]MCT7375689.1 helix-turn-helix domain-containing protein [Chelativorans sp. EGI FJ00035]
MLFRSYVPRAPLSEFVDDFWLYEDYTGAHSWERILPSGTFEMVFNLREDELRIYSASDPRECRRFAGAAVSGPYAGAFVSDTAEEAALLGVHFKPGGAFAILGLPAAAFTNLHVDLRTIWGPAATMLRERLCVMTRPLARFQLLEQVLLGKLYEPPARHGAVGVGLDVLMRTHGRERVRDIAKAVDLSPRRFIEVFTAEVGLTPKLFGRVRRFQHAAASSRSAARTDWAKLAVECGYFDQSHLIREFVEFSGLTPAQFHERLNTFDRSGMHVKRHHLPSAD